MRVDGVDQAVADEPFSWTHIPATQAENWIVGKTFTYFVGSHDGYARLADPVLHRRQVLKIAGSLWLVRDVATARVVAGLRPAGTGQSPVTTRARLNAEPRTENVGLPADVPQPARKIVSPAAAVPPARDGALLTVPHDPARTPPAEPPGYFAVEDSTVVQPAIARPTVPRPVQSLRRRDGSAAWRWRAALTFAGVVLLAAALGFGMYRTGKAAAPGSGVAPVEKVATASPEMNSLGAADSDKDAGKDPRQVSALASSPSAVKLGRNSGHAPKSAPVPKAATATASHRVGASHTQSDDLIARNTVTYLDKRFEPRPVKKSASKVKTAKSPARRRPSLRKHGGVIAANDVTYLHKPSPKAAK
jgi:hypothetical protein